MSPSDSSRKEGWGLIDWFRLTSYVVAAAMMLSGSVELRFPAGILIGICLGIADWSTFKKIINQVRD